MQEHETLYMKVKPSDVAEYVIFSGDPWRVETVKDMLEQPRHINFCREFNTYTGTYKGVRITVSSTGIGAPSAAIAMEEMAASGMKTAIRMGTIMALRDDLLGKFIIPAGAMRKESASVTYAPLSYPAIADMRVVACMNRAAAANGRGYDNGITCSMDGFYSQMRRSETSDRLGICVDDTFTELRKYGIVGVDMESSLILTLGRLMGISAGVVCMTTVLENLKQVLAGRERTEAEEILCRTALDGIVQMEESKR